MTNYKPLNAWMDSIEQGHDTLTPEDRQRLINDMDNDITTRDAIIATTLTDERAHDKNVINDLIDNPRTPKNIGLMYDMLANEQRTPLSEQTARRADTIITLLDNNAKATDTSDEQGARRYATQLAAKAYVEWLADRPCEAVHDAFFALQLLPECQLVKIVMHNIAHDIDFRHA